MNKQSSDSVFAQAFYIGNLLFVGLFYLFLWVLFILRYSKTDSNSQSHIKHALILSSITGIIFVTINLIILFTVGYASAAALIMLKLYYMLIVPGFLALGIYAFIRAIKQQKFRYPILFKKSRP